MSKALLLTFILVTLLTTALSESESVQASDDTAKVPLFDAVYLDDVGVLTQIPRSLSKSKHMRVLTPKKSDSPRKHRHHGHHHRRLKKILSATSTEQLKLASSISTEKSTAVTMPLTVSVSRSLDITVNLSTTLSPSSTLADINISVTTVQISLSRSNSFSSHHLSKTAFDIFVVFGCIINVINFLVVYCLLYRGKERQPEDLEMVQLLAEEDEEEDLNPLEDVQQQESDIDFDENDQPLVVVDAL